MIFYAIIRGPMGCGKSTIAERIAKKLKGKYITMHPILDEHDLTTDKEAGYISQQSFIKANEIIVPQAKLALKSGQSVVFDGNFYWKSQIDDLIERLDFPHYVFTLKAPLEVCIARDARRGKTHGEDAARAVYQKSTEFTYGIVIDANRALETCVKDLLSYLAKS